ncbi:hypothetical protein GUY61_31720 [Streptomyces sp. GC420]|nr:hypothetical protein [Streptomyces sp. GC420]
MRAELLRGLAPRVGAATALTLAVACASKASTWQGDWAATTSLLHSAAVLLCGPVAAAAGCLQGGRERRAGLAELRVSMARTPLVQLMAAALPLVLWVIAGYAVAAAGVLLASLPYASEAGGPVLSVVVADAVFLGAAAVAGHLLGRLVPRWAAAPAVAPVVYLLLVVSDSGDSPLRYLSPVPLSESPPLWQPPTMAVWTAGIAAAAVLAHAARRRLLALLPLGAAVVAAVVLVENGPGMWRTDPLVKRQVCDTTTTPDICVSAVSAAVLPEVRSALSGISRKLEGVANVPVRFADRPGRPARDEAALPMIRPLGRVVVRNELTDPGQFAWEAAAALTGPDACDARTEDGRAALVDETVREWLAPHPAQDYWDKLPSTVKDRARREDALAALRAAKAARARFDAMGDAERRAWLSRYFAAVGSCDPDEVPSL